MAITPFKTFASGEVLTASDLNSSITTITNNVPAVNEANTWTGIQTYSARIVMNSAAIRFAEGANVASAATTNIWGNDGNTVHVTGTTTITSLGTAGQAGDWRVVIFDGALTLTHGANLNLPGGANITTAAGDAMFVYADTTTQLDILWYTKASGVAVIGPSLTGANTWSGVQTHDEAVNWNKGADVASATTPDLGAATGNFVHITGTTTITGFGTIDAGTVRIVIFDGTLTLTHNATSLILPGAANITTAANDIACFVSEGSGNWRCVWYMVNANMPMLQGLHTIWVPARAMVARTTNGAAPGTSESTTNQVMTKTLDFDTTTQEFAQFDVQFPKSWNLGTVTFQPVWTAASGSGGVVWGLAGVALSNDDAIDTAYGTAQTSADTLIATGDIHVGPVSSAITIAGSPAASDWVTFQVNRTVADAGDTLAADAKLIGLRLFFTVNVGNDA